RGRRYVAVPDHLRDRLYDDDPGGDQLFRRYRPGHHPDGGRRHRGAIRRPCRPEAARRAVARASGTACAGGGHPAGDRAGRQARRSLLRNRRRLRLLMRQVLRFLLTAVSIAMAAPAAAQVPFGEASTVREGLEIGTSTNEIAITSDFRGADLTVFGAL